MPRRSYQIALLVLLIVALSTSRSESEKNTSVLSAQFIDSRKVTSNAGHVALAWKLSVGPDSTAEFELQQRSLSTNNRFRTVYKGSDFASFRSGLPDGMYQYRVRAKSTSSPTWGPWSAQKLLRVAHHPTSTVLLFLLSGFIVFLSTLILIFLGAMRDTGNRGNDIDGEDT